MKQKWEAIEPCLPSPTTAKSTLVSQLDPPDLGSEPPVPAHLSKAKLNIASDLLKDSHVLADTDPERVLKFSIPVRGAYDLNLVSDLEFLSLLVGRTSGEIMQM
jgi:hypothetical protein